jgi:hypothetical protein
MRQDASRRRNRWRNRCNTRSERRTDRPRARTSTVRCVALAGRMRVPHGEGDLLLAELGSLQRAGHLSPRGDGGPPTTCRQSLLSTAHLFWGEVTGRLGWCGGQPRADKAPLDARAAAGEAVTIDRVLPDRHGTPAPGERLDDPLPIRLAGTGGRRPVGHRIARDPARPSRWTPGPWWPDLGAASRPPDLRGSAQGCRPRRDTR